MMKTPIEIAVCTLAADADLTLDQLAMHAGRSRQWLWQKMHGKAQFKDVDLDRLIGAARANGAELTRSEIVQIITTWGGRVEVREVYHAS